MCSIVVFACLVHGAVGHGWVHTPVSKNEMAYHHYEDGMPDSLRYEPQTSYWGNNAGDMENGAGYSCGSKESSASQGLATWQQWYDAAKVPVPIITPGEDLALEITITADHGGQSWLTVACDDHIGEDVNWTYLERAQGDRDHHFMPSNPGIYAWATSEAASTMNDQIKASWSVPKDFTCPSGKVVGRWLWKTGSSCNDNNNVGRPTQKFVVAEFAKVVHAFGATTWVKGNCTVPAETFISCFDFMMAGVTPSPSPPTPPPKPKNPTCCFSNWGDDSACGEYTGPGGRCNTDLSKKCTGNADCKQSFEMAKPKPCSLKAVKPSCCYSKWGDANSCGDYTGPGAQCNTDHSKTCSSASDCPVSPSPAPTPPSPGPPSPTPPSPPSPPSPSPPSPPSPIAPTGDVSACHDAAKQFCDNGHNFCKACQGYGTWGNMFFVVSCNDGTVACNIKNTKGDSCTCQQKGGCKADGATCPGPEGLLV